MRRLLACLVTASALTIAPAYGQVLPPGVDIQSMVGGPYSVPAGQTTTIDLGIPVTANYSGGGWSVASAGSAVTVTAPASGSVTVPVSAQGYNATVTLIAEEGAEVPTDVPADILESVAPGAGAGAPGISSAPTAPSSVAAPSGSSSSEPNRAEAEQIHLNATIEGNKIVAKLSLSQAINLYNRFGSTSTDGVKLRYLDVNGNEIKGVKREIDKGSRTLTLTYPEGATPDNPFIMEAVKDGAAIAIVTLTDSAVPAVTPTDPAKSPSQPATVSTESSTKKYGLYAVGGVLVLLLLVGLVTSLLRRKG
ncbi:hypothetical protein CKALI_00510 [Corynebacterium kalinowskii]|uniref:Secreted protein n=1 Tax=Corynebacterium kalinowskii TaxID=2675216 RepID=A0A6B8V9E1_9CORY|nr:hypothetical protein [Corynebacterium kalinowskii]QGU01003.1 hypothetical protein CKALI_00510 [Corynebacterium kalinowskii]